MTSTVTASIAPEPAEARSAPSRRSHVLMGALFGGVLFDIVAPGNLVGINAPIIVGAFLLVAFAVAGPGGWRRMDPADRWLAPVAFLFAAMPVIRADEWLVGWDLLVAMALSAGTVACLGGGRITRGLVLQIVELCVGLVVTIAVGLPALLARWGTRPIGAPEPVRWPGPDASAPFAPPAPPQTTAAPTGTAAAPQTTAAPAGTATLAATGGAGLGSRLGGRLRAMAPILRGVVIALPIVVVFTGLFAAADAVFARTIGDLLALPFDINIEDLVGRAVVVGIVAWGAAGLLALGAGLLPAFVPGHRDAATGGPDTGDGPRILGSVEATTVLVIVDALFAVFVALQVTYLFGGRDTMAAASLTYAEYARRGFFELVMVAFLAGALAVGLDVAVGRRGRGQLAAEVGLLALTAVVLASALLRLRLYQDAFGWTELRYLVLVAILALAAGLVALGALLVTRRARWTLHVLGIGALVVLAAVNVAGPQGFVAARNLERALNPELVPPGGRTGLDAEYLWELGDEAIPAIVQAWPQLDETDRLALEPFLVDRHEVLATDPAATGWPSFNLAREGALVSLGVWISED